MKEKIRQLAKEDFMYELPNLLVSEEAIVLSVEEGTVLAGNFRIFNTGNINMKGAVYSSDRDMHLTNAMFIGENCEIQYTYDAKKAAAGQIKKGIFSIISNCGEMELAFTVKITEVFAATSIGPINDLFRFANLSQSDWEEAKKLFVSPAFSRIFLKNVDLESLYRGLKKSFDTNIAMEEFLIAIQKKLPIQIRTDQTEYAYDGIRENFKDKIVLTKDNWGYQKIGILAEGDFIHLSKNEITTGEFIGNQYELEFVIETDRLKSGSHLGRIYIETAGETVEVTIKLSIAGESDNLVMRWVKKEWIFNSTNNYLNLRTGQIAYDKYIADLAVLLKGSNGVLPAALKAIMEIHYYIMDHQSAAKDLLKEWGKKEGVLKKESILYYAAYLYLKAVDSRKEADIKRAVKEISAFYEENKKEWRFLWFLLYLDEKYDKNPEKKWQDINEAISEGENSPILYFEACKAIKEDKNAKKVFSKELLKILAFGLKKNYLKEEDISLFCFLLEDQKVNAGYLKLIISLYEKTKKKEVLHTILKILIRNEKREKEYFIWYQRGEEAHIKLENLYEYYMETLEENFHIKIPSSVLLFFQYENTLSWKKKAFLYAYIIKNKNRDMGTYILYDKTIERFAIEQIKEEHVDRNLGIIYEAYIRPEAVEERLAISLANIMFRHKLICANKKMTGVYILHKELSKEVYVPLKNGSCFIDIGTETPGIIFTDRKGNRYANTVKYDLYRLFSIQGLAQNCYRYCKNNVYLLINLFENIDKYQKKTEDMIHVQRRCALLPGLLDYYKGRCFVNLIAHYFDTMETEALKEILTVSDFSILDREFRPKAIHYCIIYDLYNKALFSMREYGFSEIPVNRLIRFCTEEIMKKEDMEKDRFLLEMAVYLFEEEKYNETILKYLIRHLDGSTNLLLKLWKRAENFDLDTYVLEERLLTLILFCESNTGKSYDVFLSYYNKGGNETLIRAYFVYNAYKYLLNDRIIKEDIFRIMLKEGLYESSMAVLLALLLYYSKKETLEKTEISFCEENIAKLEEKGMVFSFFKDFTGKINLPQEILTYYYVEYKCNPKNRVTIHFVREDEKSQEEYKAEIMENLYFGIHVMKFLLFQDESLVYYISEDDGSGKGVITKSARVDMENTAYAEEDSVYGLLNLILMAKYMHDEKTMIEMMEDFIKLNYTGDKLFKIL